MHGSTRPSSQPGRVEVQFDTCCAQQQQVLSCTAGRHEHIYRPAACNKPASPLPGNTRIHTSCRHRISTALIEPPSDNIPSARVQNLAASTPHTGGDAGSAGPEHSAAPLARNHQHLGQAQHGPPSRLDRRMASPSRRNGHECDKRDTVWYERCGAVPCSAPAREQTSLEGQHDQL